MYRHTIYEQLPGVPTLMIADDGNAAQAYTREPDINTINNASCST
jgi:hypothetical protein